MRKVLILFLIGLSTCAIAQTTNSSQIEQQAQQMRQDQQNWEINQKLDDIKRSQEAAASNAQLQQTIQQTDTDLAERRRQQFVIGQQIGTAMGNALNRSILMHQIKKYCKKHPGEAGQVLATGQQFQCP